MSILHRGGMGHRFLPAPLFSGTVMRIRGPGPILRASIHISGSGRVQSACVYRHTPIHIYMHTPAHRCAAGLPQGSRLCRNAGAGSFCGPWHTPRAAAGSVSGPTGRASGAAPAPSCALASPSCAPSRFRRGAYPSDVEPPSRAPPRSP